MGILWPGFENVRHCVSFYAPVLLFVVGCCVLSVHLMNPDCFEKAIRFSSCLFGVISFPCGRRVLFIPQDKNAVGSLWVPSMMPLWTDVIKFCFVLLLPCFVLLVVCWWLICYVS